MSSKKKYAKLTGSHLVRNPLQRFKRSILSPSFRFLVANIIRKRVRNRQMSGDFEGGKTRLSPYWFYMRKKAGYSTNNTYVKMSLKKNRRDPSRNVIIEEKKNSAGVGEMFVRIRDIARVKDLVTGRTRNISLKDIYLFHAKRYGRAYVFMTKEDEAEAYSIHEKKLDQKREKFLGDL